METVCFDEQLEEASESLLSFDYPTTLSAPTQFANDSVPVLAYYSKQDITEILSSLLNGAQLTYPEKWHDIYAKFAQWIDYPILIDEDNFTLEFVRMFGYGWNAQLFSTGTIHEPISFDNTFGNPKTSVLSAWMTSSGLTGRYVRAFIYLDQNTTIYNANFDYYAMLQENPTNSQRDLIFFDENDTQIAVSRTTSNTWTQNSWQNWSYVNASGLANVRTIYVTLTARKNTWNNSSLTKLWLDNIRINS